MVLQTLLPLNNSKKISPVVFDGQVPLAELLTRVVQSIYAELSELAETMPNMSDAARKRTLAGLGRQNQETSREAKCMNITAFLMNQNQQFEDTILGLNYAKDSFGNHDLLTSLDVLTTGSYHALPTIIKKMIVPPTPLTDAEVLKTLAQMEDVIRYRLRMHDVIPIEMSRQRIAGGRVYFTVPNLFEASFCLRGALKDDGWFFVHVEFLITVGGDLTGLHEFPRIPTAHMKRHITDEADAQLAYYLPLPDEQPPPPPGVVIPPRPQLPEGVVDAPLVRVFNFLQMMSLSYQLEILWYQAERMRSLGWAEFMTVGMSDNRKSLTVSYWIRPAVPPRQRHIKVPQIGVRTPKLHLLSELQQRAKIGDLRPSDEVESLQFEVKWEPSPGALGVTVAPDVAQGFLSIDASNLDFEALLNRVLRKHTHEILVACERRSQLGQNVFSAPGVVSIVMEDQVEVLRVKLCPDAVVLISLDSRSGRLTMRDTSDLALPEKEPQFKRITHAINDDPTLLWQALLTLRYTTITDLTMQKAAYLGLRAYRRRNFPPIEIRKLGRSYRTAIEASFNLDSQLIRQLYDYCCARTAYVKVQQQYIGRFSIHAAWVSWDSDNLHGLEFGPLRSNLSRFIPGMLVRAADILQKSPAANAAMPNIRVIPLNWWSDEKRVQVVTCVKLKYVQQPVGKNATTNSIIRFSKRIIYDPVNAVVSFLSESIETCVDEFLEEWTRVSRMVVFAREVAQMAKEKLWPDIRLLSFDLQTVSFAYSSDYVVAISCEDRGSLSGNFHLRFSRCDSSAGELNPHDAAESYLSKILRAGKQDGLAATLQRFITCLRETLPIAIELDEIQRESQGAVDVFAKSAGWYRLLLGNARHALDFRLLSQHRVLILDGSRSLYGSAPFPAGRGFRCVGSPTNTALRRTLPLSTGVICHSDLVRTLGRAIYSAVSDVLASPTT
ncbi:Mediator of RNA polymerase II transcription subunit 14 [Mycena kentingensis (nom. inval.)]|nr:Mediator of RNA polymerase II transcription subunit 14 [Mycena kentingensis (nom. inval.)]